MAGMPLYAPERMDGRSEGSLITLLVVVGVVAGLLTAGAVALYTANDEQDEAIADLRRQTSSLRSTNEKLFGRLVSATAAEQAASAEIARLRKQLAVANASLRRTRAQLIAARRAVRAHARAARRAREQARAVAARRSVYHAVARVRTSRYAHRAPAPVWRSSTGSSGYVPRSSPARRSYPRAAKAPRVSRRAQPAREQPARPARARDWGRGR